MPTQTPAAAPAPTPAPPVVAPAVDAPQIKPAKPYSALRALEEVVVEYAAKNTINAEGETVEVEPVKQGIMTKNGFEAMPKNANGKHVIRGCKVVGVPVYFKNEAEDMDYTVAGFALEPVQ